MATDNVNQSGASAVADSAKEETASLDQATGPDTAAEETRAATDANTPAQSSETQTSDDSTAEQANDAESGGGDFSALLDNYDKEASAAKQEGEMVRGTVVGISDQYVLVDIGYKSEGVVAREEFVDRQGNITVKRGDEVDVLIKSLENQEGYAILSRAAAMQQQSWDRLRRAHQNHETITGRVVERIKGGLKIDLEGVAAFLPGSQVDVRPVRNLETFMNQDIEVRVIKLNRKRGNVVVSRKAVLEEEATHKKADTLGQIEEGVIMEGVVKNITDYGAFIDLGGIDGLLHIIDMSWGRIQSPGDIIKVGDTIQVKVLKFDREKERISLGYKQLLPDPWQSVAERFPKGSH